MPIVINGRFLTRPVSGVERYALMLDAVISQRFPERRIEKPNTNGAGHAWEQLVLPRRIGAGDLLISPANTGPLRVRRQVLALHDLAWRHHPEWFSPAFVRWYEWLVPRLLRRVRHVITVSEHSRQDILRTFDMPPDRVSMVPPFIASTVSMDMPSSEEPYLLTVASRDPRKNLDRVIEAFDRYTEAPVRLLIVGRERSVFRSMEASSHERVRWMDNVDDDALHSLYAGALAVVQPSLFEGFGLPLLEAMAAGRPVIASDIPVFRECFGHAPLYVDPLSVESIGTAMKDLLHDKGLRDAHARLGYTTARRYTRAGTATALNAVLDPLLNA